MVGKMANLLYMYSVDFSPFINSPGWLKVGWWALALFVPASRLLLPASQLFYVHAVDIRTLPRKTCEVLSVSIPMHARLLHDHILYPIYFIFSLTLSLPFFLKR